MVSFFNLVKDQNEMKSTQTHKLPLTPVVGCDGTNCCLFVRPGAGLQLRTINAVISHKIENLRKLVNKSIIAQSQTSH